MVAEGYEGCKPPSKPRLVFRASAMVDDQPFAIPICKIRVIDAEKSSAYLQQLRRRAGVQFWKE